MSAKKKSRAFTEGKVKKLQRMKQPLVLRLEASGPPRNPVLEALIFGNSSPAIPLGDRLAVGHRTLTPRTEVRILVPQPNLLGQRPALPFRSDQ